MDKFNEAAMMPKLGTPDHQHMMRLAEQLSSAKQKKKL